MRRHHLLGSVVLLGVSLEAVGGVCPCKAPVTVDGRLDEPAWREAQWETGFEKFRQVVVDREVGAQTRFAVLADDKAFYLGVRCEEPNMDEVRSRHPDSLWKSDTIEFFVAPSGKTFDFYHFAVGYVKANGGFSDFASEGGNIHPDPYRPEWDFAVADCEGGWSVEIRMPFSALYMTRNENWDTTWLFNVCRTRLTGNRREYTTWSPVQMAYCEPNNFRALPGFPVRRAEDDVALLDAVAAIERKRPDGKMAGTVEVTAKVLAGGDYELVSPNLESATVKLVPGDNRIRTACLFDGNGRHDVRLELVRKATGERYVRDYPVIVDYQEVRVKLTSPEYRNNFYPGQDASRVKGVVKTAVEGEVTVSLEGPGFPRRTAKLPSGGGAIDFDTTGFEDGAATLTVEVGAVKDVRKVRKLAPTGHTMAWISGGNLIVNGKPVFRRNLYAMGYRGGRAFAEKVANDKDRHFTEEVVRGGNLEAERVLPGLERKEAIRDVRPCKAYFDRIDEMIARNRDRDFVYYYLSDEPECRGISPVYLKHIYDYITERDPYHVILTASRGGPRYAACADWFETHPYLNPHDDGHGNRRYGVAPGAMGKYLDDIGVADCPDKCVGFLPTLFSYRNQSLLNDYPTFREYVCSVWAATIHGAKSLWPYAYHDFGDRAALYEGNRYVFSSVERLSDFLLLGKRTWLVKSDAAKAVRYDLADGRSMFVLVNLTQRPQKASLAGLSGTYAEFRGERSFACASGRPAEFDLAPLEVVIGTSVPCDRGLSSFAETEVLIDRQEYARTHRDNQLLENYRNVRFESSNGDAKRERPFKLIDGTRDVYGWSSPWSKKPWLALETTDGAVRFDTVRLYGSAISTAKLSVGRDGVWSEVAVKGETDDVYFKEIVLAEPVEANRLRIDFPPSPRLAADEAVEVYEIEIPKLNSREN